MKVTTKAKLILEAMLNQPKGITRSEINEVLVSNGEKPVERRKLFKYLSSFRQTMGLDIAKEHIGGLSYRYRLADTDGMPPGYSTLYATHLLEMSFMQNFSQLGARIQPITITRGGGYLRPIGEAMKANHLLRVIYQKFSDVEPYECILAPHVLKAFEGRWYLLAVKWMSEEEIQSQPLGYKGLGLQTFALDRMLDIKEINQRFQMLKGFDAATFFEPYFGVCCEMGAKPVKIKVHASEDDAHYIRTLPIHLSQKEKKHNEFELKLVPAKDFEIYMRRFPDTTWEVVEEKRGRKSKMTVK